MKKEKINTSKDRENKVFSSAAHERGQLDEYTINGANSIEGVKDFAGLMDMMFFRPDQTFIEWIVAYAGKRIICEVGCGSCKVLFKLRKAGGRVFGIEPNLDSDNFMAMNIEASQEGISGVINVIPRPIQQCGTFLEPMGADKVIYLFARPCHSTFVEDAIDLMPNGVESLYITTPANIERYDDLGKYKSRAKLIKHSGRSADKEVVYSVKK